jgi:hypothetical protein
MNRVLLPTRWPAGQLGAFLISHATLKSLYRNHGQYVAGVAEESNRLVREGFWLRPDAQEVIKQAEQADVP